MADEGNVLTPEVRASRRLGHQFVGVLENFEREYRTPGTDKSAVLQAFDTEWPQIEHVFATLAPLYRGDTQSLRSA